MIPTYEWYQSMAKNASFQKTLGSACQLAGGNYDNVRKIPKHNCQNYLFWNDVHPTTPAQAMIAKRFLTLQSD